MSAERTCPFCSIARGDDADVEVVCRGEGWVAFFPLEPATPGHTLIIPNTHVSDLWEADRRIAEDVMDAVWRVGRAIRESLRPDGLNLITSAGRVAEQTVFHLHLHVVPRWAQDNFGPIWPIAGITYSDDRLQDVSNRIRAACGPGKEQ
jgi:histidine triad (HIT) family protein